MKPKEHSTHARSDIRCREIIQAALSCFVEYGYAATTMEDIRQRSKASNGSIYHHFKSKEQLAEAIYLEGIIDYQSRIAASLDHNPGAREGIGAIIRHHLGWVGANPDWARYLLQMGNSNLVDLTGSEIEKKNLQFLGSLLGWIKPHIDNGDLRSMPLDIMIPLILSPSYEFSRLWLSGMALTGIDEAGEVLVDAAWQSLKADRSDRHKPR